jgi:hypothetical protein
MSKIVVNISSYKRDEGLKKVISSILHKCDKINVALNSFNGEIPDFLYHNKINILITDNSKGDAFKFYFLKNHDDVFYITLDDDINYPENFIELIIQKCEQYKRKSVITYHGRTFERFPVKSYYSSPSKRFHFLNEVNSDVKIQFGGTGLMCFHTDLLKIPFDYFKYPNMADIWVGKYCIENNIEIICAEHRKNLFTNIDFQETIYNSGVKNDRIQTLVVNSIYDKTIKLDFGNSDIVENKITPIKIEEKPIPIKSTIEKSVKKINYEKVNQIFNNVPSHRSVRTKTITGNSTLKTNSSMINKLILNKKKR